MGTRQGSSMRYHCAWPSNVTIPHAWYNYYTHSLYVGQYMSQKLSTVLTFFVPQFGHILTFNKEYNLLHKWILWVSLLRGRKLHCFSCYSFFATMVRNAELWRRRSLYLKTKFYVVFVIKQTSSPEGNICKRDKGFAHILIILQHRELCQCRVIQNSNFRFL